MRSRSVANRRLAATALLAPLLTVPAAHGQFVEPGVEVLFTHLAEAPGDNYGWVAERIGDLDGDGASEYIITAILNSEGGVLAGKAYVYSGADGSLIMSHVGGPRERLGFGVAGGGDADNDGVPDYLIGAPGIGSNAARVLVVSGADHSLLFQVTDGPGTLFGFDVGFTGDIDDDDHDDIIVGATAAGGQGRVDLLSGLDGSLIWSRDGAPGSGLGSAVTGLDDLNGDGIPELGAGAQNGGPGSIGEAFLFDGVDGSTLRTLHPEPTGSAFGFGFVHDAGDVNHDGVGDVYVGDFNDSAGGRGYVFSGAADERLRLITADNPGDGLGIGRGAGDIDGDSHDDLLIGAYLNSDGAPQGGKCLIISGRTGETLRTFTLAVPNGQLGFDVANLGDLTGDNGTDFLLTGLDRAYVVAGLPKGLIFADGFESGDFTAWGTSVP
jgi:hypothetical protein